MQNLSKKALFCKNTALYIQLYSSEHWQHKRKYKIIEKINNLTKKQTNN